MHPGLARTITGEAHQRYRSILLGWKMSRYQYCPRSLSDQALLFLIRCKYLLSEKTMPGCKVDGTLMAHFRQGHHLCLNFCYTP